MAQQIPPPRSLYVWRVYSLSLCRGESVGKGFRVPCLFMMFHYGQRLWCLRVLYGINRLFPSCPTFLFLALDSHTHKCTHTHMHTLAGIAKELRSAVITRQMKQVVFLTNNVGFQGFLWRCCCPCAGPDVFVLSSPRRACKQIAFIHLPSLTSLLYINTPQRRRQLPQEKALAICLLL